jgi:ATP-dependent protease ClpP protease subunit
MTKKHQQEDSISDIHTSNIDVENRIIYLQEKEDSSSESSGVDFRMVQMFMKNINILQSISLDPITVYMQTVGGCWYSGMGIYDAIKLSKCKVNVIGYSQICSMGTIIMQAADKRILMPSCIFMCHYGSSDHTGDFLSSQNFAQVDKQNCQIMVDIYAERCHKTGKYFRDRADSLSRVKSYIKRKMKDGDWYLNAVDAIDYGFADYVFSNSLKI